MTPVDELPASQNTLPFQYGSKGVRHSPILGSFKASEIYAAVDTGGPREVNGAALE